DGRVAGDLREILTRTRSAQRRRGRIDRGDGEVGRHDGADARPDRGAERNELDTVETLGIDREDRKRAVRVGPRVAVPREVLDGRQDASGLDSAHERRYE